jgi:hypothetical protein
MVRESIIVWSLAEILVLENDRSFTFKLAHPLKSVRDISFSSTHLLYLDKKNILRGLGAGDKGALGIDYFLGGKRR